MKQCVEYAEKRDLVGRSPISGRKFWRLPSKSRNRSYFVRNWFVPAKSFSVCHLAIIADTLGIVHSELLDKYFVIITTR